MHINYIEFPSRYVIFLVEYVIFLVEYLRLSCQLDGEAPSHQASLRAAQGHLSSIATSE